MERPPAWGGFDLRSGEADLGAGKRLVAERGLAGAACKLLMHAPDGADRFRAVQAVDPSFQGGPFKKAAGLHEE